MDSEFAYTPNVFFGTGLHQYSVAFEVKSYSSLTESFESLGFATGLSLPPIGGRAGMGANQRFSSFTVINMNGRAYDPLVGRFLSADPYIQAPDNTQNLNRYSYCLNNPLRYTDPSGEFIFTLATVLTGQWYLLPMAIGADIGMYAGGSIANGTMNPFKWDYSSLDTWSGMAMGALAGGLASQMMFGPGGALMGGSSFNLSLGISNSVGSGFANFSIGGSSVFSLKGLGYVSVAGGGVYLTAASLMGSNQTIDMPAKPKWDGLYFQGSEKEANEMLLISSKTFNVEASYWSTSKGYYFEPLQGMAYGYSYNEIPSLELTDYNIDIGFNSNTINSAYRYTFVEKTKDALYLHPNFAQGSFVYYKAHTHPKSSPPGRSDLLFSYLFGIRCTAIGWNGIEYKYGGSKYWK